MQQTMRDAAKDPATEEAETIEVEFDVTESDLLAFNRYYYWRQPKTWFNWMYYGFGYASPYLFLIYVVTLFPATGSVRHTVINMLAALLATELILVLILLRTPALAMKRSLRRGHGGTGLGPQIVRLTPEYLHTRNWTSEARCAWPEIWKIATTRNHCFLFLNPIMAHVVPARVFESEADFERFVATARRWRQEGQGYGLVCPKCGYNLHGVTERGCPECGWGRRGEEAM